LATNEVSAADVNDKVISLIVPERNENDVAATKKVGQDNSLGAFTDGLWILQGYCL
jgi:hypothetical protein